MIGPYFFENDDGTTVTVKSLRYGRMITGFYMPAIEEYDLENMWFQQDDATCHTARITMDLLRGAFGEYFILPSRPVNWPHRSCDLTCLDYFLWGYVKAHVYRDKPASIHALEDNIHT